MGNGFYFLARKIAQGTYVELTVHAGLRDHNPTPIGQLTFERAQWETFRPIIQAGMHAAGLMKTPVDFFDETRGQPRIARPAKG